MLLKKIQNDLENGGVLTEETLNLIKKYELDVDNLKLELSKAEVKNQEIIDSREKIKNLNSLFKKNLEIEDGVEITEEKIKDKINKKTTADKLEIKAIEHQIVKLKTEYDEIIKTKETKLFEKDIDLEILKSGTKINCISPVALNVIMEELKKGAIIEDNKIIYKKDNQIVRKEDGLPVSLSDKINELKNNDNYKGFFIADVQSGSGFKSKTTAGNVVPKTGNAIADRIRERAQAQGINL